jgi:hypothetical protein
LHSPHELEIVCVIRHKNLTNNIASIPPGMPDFGFPSQGPILPRCDMMRADAHQPAKLAVLITCKIPPSKPVQGSPAIPHAVETPSSVPPTPGVRIPSQGEALTLRMTPVQAELFTQRQLQQEHAPPDPSFPATPSAPSGPANRAMTHREQRQARIAASVAAGRDGSHLRACWGCEDRGRPKEKGSASSTRGPSRINIDD